MAKKKGGSSWLSAVKRAFRSPTKDNSCDKKAKREHELEEDEEKVILLTISTKLILVHYLYIHYMDS